MDEESPSQKQKSLDISSTNYRIEKPRNPENTGKIGQKKEKYEKNWQKIGFCLFFSYFLDFWVFLFCSWSTRCQKKSRKKSPGAGVPKVRKKSRTRSENSKKKGPNMGLETFRTFSETFFGLLGLRPGPGRLFRDFLAFGPETPSPRSTEPQA